MPRAQNTEIVQAITIASLSAMLEQARHVTSRLVTTRQDQSCRVVLSQVEFVCANIYTLLFYSVYANLPFLFIHDVAIKLLSHVRFWARVS